MFNYLKSKNFNEICRTCLKTTKRTHNLFHMATEAEKTMVDMLETITILKIDRNNKLPQKICHKCITFIKNAFNFKIQVEQNEKILSNFLNPKQVEGFNETIYSCKTSNSSLSNNYYDCEKLKLELNHHENNDIFQEPEIILDSLDDISKQKEFMIMDNHENKDCNINTIQLLTEEEFIKNPTNVTKTLKNGQIMCSILDPRFDYDKNGDYLCTLCQTSFTSKRYLLRHKAKHRKQIKKAEKQELKKFQSESKSKNHIEYNNPEGTFIDEKSTVVNFETEMKVYPKEEVMINTENNCNPNHNEYKANDMQIEQLDNILKFTIRRKRVQRKIKTNLHICEICKKTCRSNSVLKIHMVSHDPNRPKYKCKICHKEFLTESYLKLHTRSHHDGEIILKKYQQLCMYCGKYVKDLIRHIPSHTQERSYKCDECPKSFLRKDHLQNHKLSHSEEKQFSCDICGKCFHTRNKLTCHKRIHGDEKKNKCTYCDKAFIYPKELTYHMRRHTDEKPFECGDCEKAFVLKNELTKHCKVRNHQPKQTKYDN